MIVTLGSYYKSFTNLRALFALIPFAPTLAHAFLPDSGAAGYLYPPLGDFEPLGIAATLGLLLLTTFVVYISARLSRRIQPLLPIFLGIGSAVCVVALIALYVSYVRFVGVSSVGAEVPVSVGYQETEFALRTYPQQTDWEMLHNRGPWEERIQKLWTLQSIIVVRSLLWVFYTLALACFLAVVSLAAYEHASEPTPPLA
jgi:hypothetical protein